MPYIHYIDVESNEQCQQDINGLTRGVENTPKRSSYKMSSYQTSIYQTSSYRTSMLQNVQVAKCPGYKMSILQNVQVC
jgi:hypothetical protein